MFFEGFKLALIELLELDKSSTSLMTGWQTLIPEASLLSLFKKSHPSGLSSSEMLEVTLFFLIVMRKNTVPLVKSFDYIFRFSHWSSADAECLWYCFRWVNRVLIWVPNSAFSLCETRFFWWDSKPLVEQHYWNLIFHLLDNFY